MTGTPDLVLNDVDEDFVRICREINTKSLPYL